MTAAEAYREIQASLARGEPVVEVVVTSSSVAGVAAGARMLVWKERSAGDLADDPLHERVLAAAREKLDADRPNSLDLQQASGDCTIYLEPHRPPDPLVIVGAGHIAQPLSKLGAMLGYRVTVLDDRPEFATSERFPDAVRVLAVDFRDPFADVALGTATRLVLVTRGHRHDFEALRLVLRLPEPPEYIGMVGSQRRVRATLEQLVREGIAPGRLAGIHAPVGLDIGAETPAEIAISIAAELVRLRRGGSGESLRDRTRVLERWISTA